MTILFLPDKWGQTVIDDLPRCGVHAYSLGGWSHTCNKGEHTTAIHSCSCGWIW